MPGIELMSEAPNNITSGRGVNEGYLLESVRNKAVTLLLPDEFTVDKVTLIG